MTNDRKYQIWAKTDFGVQAFLVVATVVLSVAYSPIFLLFMAMPIGAWQVLAGLISFFGFKKNDRKFYLLAVAAYGIFYLIADQYQLVNATFMLTTIPLAAWSFWMAWRDFRGLRAAQTTATEPPFSDPGTPE
jgi:hypothetical protein